MDGATRRWPKERTMSMSKMMAALVLTLAMLMSACSTMRGSPKPLLSRGQINGTTIVDAQAQMVILTNPPTLEARNEALLKLLSLADMRYAQYRIDLVNNRRGTRAGAGGLTLLADVAATLTNSVGVKDNYIALSALIDGGEAVFDKEYLFDKTIDSLIARMDADRKAELASIYEKLELDLTKYPGHSALADALEYFSSGTLDSALVSVNKTVQRTAEADMAESERILKSVVSPTAASRAEGNDRMRRFVASLNEANMDKLRDFLRANQIDVDQAGTDDAKRTLLRQGLTLLRTNFIRANRTDADVVAELKKAGFNVPD
jgi:hypothetical protein